MKILQISEFQLGEFIQGYYLCTEKYVKYTNRGDQFLDIVVADSTGMITGKIWDFTEHFQNKFQTGDPVAVKGKITEYNEQLQLHVTQINRATCRQYGKYGYSDNLLIRTINESTDKLWNRLRQIIESLSAPYNQITRIIFQNHEKKIKIIPLSISCNQPVRGSFLKFLVELGEKVISFLPGYPMLDRDLVLCGTLLYKIGKVEAFNNDIYPNLTELGSLIGYSILGRDILRQANKSIKNFPENILMKLEYIILSQRESENQYFKKIDKFPEAVFVNYIYKMDEEIGFMFESNNRNIKK